MRKATIFVCLLLLGFLLGMPSPALAFDRDIHVEITKDVLNSYTVNGVDGHFSASAIKTIADSNYHTDDPNNQENSEMHFDSENFSGGSKRIKDLKEQIVTRVEDALKSGNTATYAIYTRLGTALHTVQDFYAHSNWVEIHKDSPEINTDLGRKEFSGADKETKTCPTDPATLDGEGLKQLTSGYFYSLLQPCKYPPGIISGKCLHGWSYSLPSGPCGGLNKDKPGRPGYETAEDLAVKATKDYLDQILKEGSLAGNVDAVKFLMGIK